MARPLHLFTPMKMRVWVVAGLMAVMGLARAEDKPAAAELLEGEVTQVLPNREGMLVQVKRGGNDPTVIWVQPAFPSTYAGDHLRFFAVRDADHEYKTVAGAPQVIRGYRWTTKEEDRGARIKEANGEFDDPLFRRFGLNRPGRNQVTRQQAAVQATETAARARHSAAQEGLTNRIAELRARSARELAELEAQK